MAVSFSPKGFDPDRKKRAAECLELWETATQVLGFLGVAATVASVPVAAGFLVTASLGPFLGHPMRRIRNDPPRADFYVPTEVRPQTLDPTLAFGPGDWPSNGRVEILVALAVGIDRAGAYLDAMVDAGERATGAFVAGSFTALDLRLAEMRHNAARSVASSKVVYAAAQDYAQGQFNVPRSQLDVAPEESLRDVLGGTIALRQYLETGAREAFLETPMVLFFPPSSAGPEPRQVVRAAQRTYELAHSLESDLPGSVEEFIEEGDDTEHPTRY